MFPPNRVLLLELETDVVNLLLIEIIDLASRSLAHHGSRLYSRIASSLLHMDLIASEGKFVSQRREVT